MKKWAFFLIILGVGVSVRAQITSSVGINVTLPTVSLLDIEPATGINLSLQAPAEAGNPLTTTMSSTKYLNFTSAVMLGGNRAIFARISSGSVPSGLGLRLYVGAGSGTGAIGGRTTSSLLVDGIDRMIVSGIGGAFTGSGMGVGYPVSYGLEIQNYSQLKYTFANSLTITYTILDY